MMHRIHDTLLRLSSALLLSATLSATGYAQDAHPSEPSPAEPPSTGPLPPPPAPAPKDAAALEQDRLAEAKALFQQGNALRQTGDCQRALDFYLRSRALAPSPPNTLNAAFCLKELKRLDEALELYEDALTRFRSELPQSTSDSLGNELRELRATTSALEVSSNVNGALVIDGRERGRLPLAAPVRLMPGQRTVRIIQDGYVTFEVELDLAAGESRRLDAKLQPLASAGRVRIEAKDGDGAVVFVDGARVGALPWEGTLAPGKHLFALTKGDLGTGPAPITVVQGQTVLMSVELKPLGPPIRITVEPSSANLVLDGVQLGSSSWQGRLPLGTHRAETSLEGYHPVNEPFNVQSDTTSDVVLKLQVDPNHPRWATRLKTSFWVEGFGGGAWAPKLGNDAESACDCSAASLGFIAGARAGLGFGDHLSIELGGSWLSLASDLSWEHRTTYDSDPASNAETQVPLTYHFEDEQRLRGVLASLGLSYFWPLGDKLSLGGRVHGGVFFANAITTTTNATRSTATESEDVVVDGTASGKHSARFMLSPELALRWKLSKLHFALGVGAVVVPGHGNAQPTGETHNTGICPPGANPLPLVCASGSGIRKDERSFGQFIAVTPTVGVGYTF